MAQIERARDMLASTLVKCSKGNRHVRGCKALRHPDRSCSRWCVQTVTALDILRSETAEHERIPPCAAAMGCLCAGHARGDDASAQCNTDEEAR